MTQPLIKNEKMASLELPHDPGPNAMYARLKCFKQNKNTDTTHLAVLKDYWITHSVFRYFAKDGPTG